MAIAHVPHAALGREEDVSRPRTTLEEIHEALDVPGWRIEILEGRIVMSPSPIKLHSRIINWLARTLDTLCDEKGWECLTQVTLDLVATRDRVEPDLLVYPLDEVTDGQWLLPVDRAILVVEVVSPSSRHDDYKTKRRACALNHIPLYLVIDPEASSLTLYSLPGEEGYRQVTPLPAGGRLDLPEPLGFALDTAEMPGKRR